MRVGMQVGLSFIHFINLQALIGEMIRAYSSFFNKRF